MVLPLHPATERSGLLFEEFERLGQERKGIRFVYRIGVERKEEEPKIIFK